MIILDESRLTNGTLSMIGQDYGMKMPNEMDIEAYEKFIDDVVERFKFEFKIKWFEKSNKILYNNNEMKNSFENSKKWNENPN